MRQLTPALALLGLVLIGCTGPTSSDESPDSSKSTAAGNLHHATVEVKGMT